ncbi:acyltransferase [Rhodomicrobium sp. Az07]|uniref:acyltransferase family protein n=1 Tax=Rhodomicrobium sp. Az07 TaxID=2839034 RepID=UPI001BEB95D1|nr:acyltransferase family protein [Rhodomicrobium sp. Az07]MBT3070707.1 acyltransferase [Rhodomicrobium sp. Az07]
MITYRSEIDGLRAIAIASVVLHHSGSQLFSGGYVGVDVFFVISGFLITSIIAKARAEGDFSWVGFYARRARRILPALFALLAAVAVASLVILAPTDLIQYGRMLIYTILFVSNFRLAAEQNYFNPTSQDNPLLHMWSLSVEEQFYLFWPIILVAAVSLSPRRERLIVWSLAALSLVTAILLLHFMPKSAFYHLPSRGWELLAGALIALGHLPRIGSKAVATTLSVLGVVLIAVPVVAYDASTPFPGFFAVPPVLGCALVIFAEGQHRSLIGKILSLRPIVALGLISYSLYLWHWPILAFPHYLLKRELTGQETAILVAIATLIAFLSWRYVEQPFRKAQGGALIASEPASGFRWSFNRSAYGGGAIAVALIAFGSYVQESRGALWRFPADIERLVKAIPQRNGRDCTHVEAIEPRLSRCELGAPASTVSTGVIIWGDSHAEHFRPLLKAVYGDAAAYTHRGCQPLLDVYVASDEDRGRGCFKRKKIAFNRILAENPRVVVIAGYWLYASRYPVVRTLDQAVDATSSRLNFEASLKEEIRRLTDRGTKVILMGQVPVLRFGLRECPPVFRFFGREIEKCLYVRRRDAERDLNYVNRVLASLAVENPMVKVFWPVPGLCKEDKCRVAKDAKPLYVDSNHLTPIGAMSLVDLFKSTIPPDFIQLKNTNAASLTHPVAN